MDVDLESVEIVFAQKLACGEPGTRKRALNALHDWIKEQSAIKAFSEDDMIRLCKGLHYVMWMQDKMLLQEELADIISNLLQIFDSEAERVLFIKCIFKSLSKEWHNVDRWRMDKFLMLIRRVIRVLFAYLSSCKWKKSVREQYFNAFRETTITSNKSVSEGLKFHFASLVLDELDNAGGLTKKQITAILEPFAELLADKNASNYLFDSIIDEVFATILHQKSEELAAAEEGEEVPQGGIQFDYNALGKMLMNIGKREEINASRRKKIYALVKKYKSAAQNQDPYHFEPPQPQEVLTEADVVKSIEKLEKYDEENCSKRKKRKLC